MAPVRVRQLAVADISSTSGDTIWHPWSDGFAIGFRIEHVPTGRVRYLYLNPSTEGDLDPGGDLGTTFLYWGETGRPWEDGTVSYTDAMMEG